MNLSFKDVAVVVGSAAVLSVFGYLAYAFNEARKETPDAETETEAKPGSQPDPELIAAVNAALVKAAAEYDLGTMYTEQGDVVDRLREALALSVLYYTRHTDLTDRKARKHLPFLDGIEDVALRSELDTIAKRLVGRVYVNRDYDGAGKAPVEDYDYILSLFN